MSDAANGLTDLKTLQNTSSLVQFFSQHGVSEESAHRRAAQFCKVAAALESRLQPVFGDSKAPPKGGTPAPAIAYFVPGRIEVLGKHTDYGGGKSVVCTVDRGFAIIAVPSNTPQVNIFNVATGEHTTFEISPGLSPTMGHWSNYPMTVARRLATNFSREWRGGDIAFISDLPVAAGLSSSSALVVATFRVLAAINHLENDAVYRASILDIESLASYLGATENGGGYGKLTGTTGVGTFGGSEDHTAILCSRPNMLRCFSYAPTNFVREVAMPAGWTFAIGSSAVKAEKTGNALHDYNNLSLLAADAAALWRKQTGFADINLAAMMANSEFSIERFAAATSSHDNPALAARLIERVRHFHLEDQQVIPTALDALAAGGIPAFAEAVQASQQAAEQLLGNQVEATTALVRFAKESGAVAASAFGAGFGGSVWALVPENSAEPIRAAWTERYRRAFPQNAANAEFFLTPPATATMPITPTT